MHTPKLATDHLLETGRFYAYETDIKKASLLQLQKDIPNQPELFRLLLNHYFDTQLTKHE